MLGGVSTIDGAATPLKPSQLDDDDVDETAERPDIGCVLGCKAEPVAELLEIDDDGGVEKPAAGVDGQPRGRGS